MASAGWRLPMALSIGDCRWPCRLSIGDWWHDARVSILLVGLGGAVGSVVRYSIGLAFAGASFPYATLIVNGLGCLLIGLALPAWDRAPVLSEGWRLVLVVGFLGGFTTFSAFGHETAVLLEQSPFRAAVNVAANVLIGLGAVLAGRAAALRIFFA